MKGKEEKASLKAIFANRRLVLLLCYILFLFIGLSSANTFLGIYYATPQGLNAGLGTYGLYFTICIATETSLMLFGNRFWSKIHIYHIFLLVCLGACFRSLIVFLAPNIYVLQLSTIGHALLFAPLWSRLSPYVNSIVTKEMRATGQAAWYIMAFGLGPVLGSALGGWVANLCGIRNLFAVSAGMLFIVAVVFYFLFRRQRVLDAAEV
jgi:MFS family permease